MAKKRALDPDMLLQILRYGLAGAAAVVTQLVVLVLLTAFAGLPSTLASAVGFGCAVPVNYALQLRFVFKCGSQHRLLFPRYVSVTLLTLALNTAVFWLLTAKLGLFYVSSQVVTIGLIVPLNYALNRCFTFSILAAPRSGMAISRGGNRPPHACRGLELMDLG